MAAARSTTTSTPTEVVPGLVEAPDKGQFLIRKNSSTEEGAPAYEMILRVEGEEDYVVTVDSADDGYLSGTAYSLIAQRRTRLREQVIESNTEVVLSNS